MTLTLPRKARREMKVLVRYEGPIPAPVAKGDRLATLVIRAKGIDDVEVPLVAASDVGQLGLFGRLGAALQHIIWGGS